MSSSMACPVSILRSGMSSSSMTAAMAASMAASMASAISMSMPYLATLCGVPMTPTMATRAVMAVRLRHFLSLLFDVGIHEIADVMRTNVCKFRHLHSTFDSRQYLCKLVDGADSIFHFNGMISGDEIQLIQDDLVCKCDLLVCLVDFALFHLII